MKRIYFYPFGTDSLLFSNYMDVKQAIDCKINEIHTSSMANFSFDLLDKGYEIYLVSRKNHAIRIEPNMSGLEKELRTVHNILKMFLAGAFDHLIYD